MFGFNKAKKADVLSHWYTLVDQFNIPSKDFYESINRELTLRKVPGLKMSIVTFSEGGVLSANRAYLRMKRERLVFDICAAPFGTSYFFSMRFAELPPGGFWWRWTPLLVGFLAVWIASDPARKTSYSLLVEVLMAAAVLGLMVLLWMIIWLVENHFYTESYYRQDTRLMYLELVNAVVKQKIAESTSAKGINLLDIRQHSPLMDDLYRTTRIDIDAIETPPDAPPLIAEPAPA